MKQLNHLKPDIVGIFLEWLLTKCMVFLSVVKQTWRLSHPPTLHEEPGEQNGLKLASSFVWK
jgi:hypothetical protein